MKQRDIYLLLISSFVLVFIWIVFTIYHNSVTSTIPEVLNVQIIPIKPDFDLKTISDIKTRTDVTPIYTPLINPESEQVSPTPTPTPFISPIPTTPALITPAQASPEGNLLP